MSKFQPLWNYIICKGIYPLKLSFDDINAILGFSLDHSFLSYKKETLMYGFIVQKISLKDKFVVFDRC